MLTGGQDDLISIWHVPGSALIARCQGHRSWVTSVAFDPWRCDDRNYRFGSVGEDRRLCLWDFSVGMLHRPRGATATTAPTAARHGSVASRGTAALARAETMGSEREGDSGLGAGAGRNGAGANGAGRVGPHPVEPRASTAMLPPVLSKVVDVDPLAWLEFTEDAIMTSCKSGMSIPLPLPVLLAHLCLFARTRSSSLSLHAVLQSRHLEPRRIGNGWLTVFFARVKGTSGRGSDRPTRRPRSVRPRRVDVL